MIDESALTVLLTADQLRDRVRELAADINTSYPAGRDPHLVSVLKGGFIFLADLVRALDRPVTIVGYFVALASYGTGIRSSGVVTLTKDVEIGITGRDVLGGGARRGRAARETGGGAAPPYDAGSDACTWLLEHVRTRARQAARSPFHTSGITARGRGCG